MYNDKKIREGKQKGYCAKGLGYDFSPRQGVTIRSSRLGTPNIDYFFVCVLISKKIELKVNILKNV